MLWAGCCAACFGGRVPLLLVLPLVVAAAGCPSALVLTDMECEAVLGAECGSTRIGDEDREFILEPTADPGPAPPLESDPRDGAAGVMEGPPPTTPPARGTTFPADEAIGIFARGLAFPAESVGPVAAEPEVLCRCSRCREAAGNSLKATVLAAAGRGWLSRGLAAETGRDGWDVEYCGPPSLFRR